jgi:dihydrofolate reductase
MRTVTYGAACSLDGFIGRPDGGVDWLHFSRDVQQIMADYWARIDTVLMGRRTWQAAAGASGGGAGMKGIEAYVFSRTLEPGAVRGATLVRDDAAGFVRSLKARPGRDICVMGGGDLARSLIAGGVVDEIGVNIHPVLLGSGIPLFVDPGRQVDLALSECRQLDGGCVYAVYKVAATRHAQPGTKTGRRPRRRQPGT